MDGLEKKLKKSLEGEVRFDEISRATFSTDASIYEVRPRGVIFPKSINDVIKAIQIAKDERVSVIPRGAATGITGGCLGEGLVIDLSRFLNKILHIDPQQKIAICEPGVVQDALNAAAAPYGLRLGPDTSTGNRATLGGMLANNAAGAHSLLYGSMAYHIIETELVLADGTVRSFGPVSLEKWESLSASDPIYATCWKLRQTLGDEIRERFPPLPRRVSGYNFPALLEDTFNINKLIAGSEGTLGITSQMTVKLSPVITNSHLCLIQFTSLLDAFAITPQLLKSHPIALEVIDSTIMHAGKSSPAFKGRLDWLEEIPAALLVLEFDGIDAKERAQAIAKVFPKCSFVLSTPQEMRQVWELRKAGLGLLMSKRSYNRAVAFVEDISVAPTHLATFMKEFIDLLHIEGKTAGIYGHAGAGCMHIRPYMDLRSYDDRKTMEALMHATTVLLLKHRGVLSGEHGDGLIRSWLNETLFGPHIYQGFVEFKNAFDSDNLMNPNKIVRGPPLLDNLRQHPDVPVETFLDFQPEGGIDLAVDMCNGNGLCRKKEGTMCPSFQATGDEKDSTRARANALRAVMVKGNSIGDLGSAELQGILDLCLSCKGCKTECPSQVDMAKLKAESQYHYHQRYGTTLRTKAFAHIGKLFSIGAAFPQLTNKMANSRLGKKLGAFFGISPQRTLPTLAAETFDEWVSKQRPSEGEKVILFNDTFTNFIHPEVGIAAYRVLEAMGFSVIVPAWNCCGRTALSKGLLPEARNYGQTLIEALKKLPQAPLIALEPSCWSALIDDYHSLKLTSPIKAYLLEEFLLNNLPPLQSRFHAQQSEVAIHIHCHQKALGNIQTVLTLFRALPGIHPIIIESGCCGMAGSFGYESEHATLSFQIAELTLFPALRKLPAHIPIIANGTSCRSQINEGTSRKAIHFAEYLSNNLTKSI